ncbi:TPM domain-containing protein [Aggregatibacter kilianii]|uniref:TPM domain-containing protein n=1 Tax=Aggregatibacter kilianii TaxID=2025884 RepID=UPI000D64CBDE|nr:TPM domain-containing protein [Aggregatibacter kilianii]
MPLFAKLPIDKKQLEAEVLRLEQQTSAEFRIFIERKIPQKTTALSAYERALQVFAELEMQHTAAHNGVLIYIAFQDRQCAIVGDIGIHQYVGDDFWQTQCDLMITRFKQKQYTQGILTAMQNIGAKLAQHFPIQPDDRDELDNEVIIHD